MSFSQSISIVYLFNQDLLDYFTHLAGNLAHQLSYIMMPMGF